MKIIKYILGLFFSVVFKEKKLAVLDHFTIPSHGLAKHGFVERMIRYYIAHSAQRTPEQSLLILERIHRHYWSRVDSYFNNTSDRTSEIFIPTFGGLIEQIALLLQEKQIVRVCELGTGDGKWLNYLSQKLLNINQFVGIDISSSQIEKNTIQYPNLEFANDDILQWTRKNVSEHTLYHTMGGVLEYLAEPSLKELFQILRCSANNSFFLLCEPLYDDFDLHHDMISKVSGNEYSYSHNYPKLLLETHARIVMQKEFHILDHRLLMILAEVGPSSPGG